MSETIARIFAETDARLRSANGPEEVRKIGLEHVAAVATSLADTVFLANGGGAEVLNEQAASLIISTHEGLLTSLADAFTAQGIQDTPLQTELCDKAGRAFLDRLESLFDGPQTRGCA